MEASVEAQLGRIEEKINRVVELLDEHHESLYGNGKPGLVIDVDRLKQNERRRCNQLKLVCGAALGGLFTALGDIACRFLWH